jgi:hypothetical protein
MGAARSQAAGSVRILGDPFLRKPPTFLFQVLAPGAGDPEDAAFVGAFVPGQTDTAVAVARPGSGEGNPEQKPVGPLARAGASNRNMRHWDIEGTGVATSFVNGPVQGFVPRHGHRQNAQFVG